MDHLRYRMANVTSKTATLIVLSAVLSAPVVYAADDSQQFVEALRRKGYYDLAIEYLEAAPQNPVTSEAFRARLPYEQAITLLEQTRLLKTTDARQQAIQSAKANLDKFLRANSDPALAAGGQSRLASAYAEDARQAVAKAARTAAAGDKAEANKLQQTARKSYDDARKIFLQAEASYTTALKKYKTVKPNSPEANTRLELRGQLAQVRLLSARLLAQKASAYDEGSKEFKKLKQEAAKELGALFEKYSSWLVGFYAHLYEGQCYQAIGDHKLAISCFSDLIEQDDSEPTFRRLITLAYAYLSASHTSQKAYDKVLADPQQWLNRLGRDDLQSPEARALQYQIAVAAQLSAAKEEGDDARRQLKLAQKLLRASTAPGRPHDFSAQATEALATVNAALGSSKVALENFIEAYQEGKGAINAFSSARVALGVAEKNNPSSVDELTAQVEDSRTQALSAFRQALALVDEDSSVAQINEVRYLLSWLYWEEEQYLEAAIVGQFLATRQPDDPSAESAAKLAIVALEKLYQQSVAAGGDGDFEAGRLKQLATFITKRWAGSDTADAAFGVLVNLALKSGRLSEAEEVLQSVAEDRRPVLELRLATAAWEQAVRNTTPNAINEKATAAEMLGKAFEKVRKLKPITASTATAALYLSQAKLEMGEFGGAIKLLENKQVGPLKLIERKSAAVDRPGYAAEAYKSALRAYVSATPPRTDDAMRIMNQLEKAVAATTADPNAVRKALTRIYFGLGVQLQRQIESLTATGKTEEADRVGGAFATFLTRLDEQATDADWITKQWIGQSFMQLGDSVKGRRSESTKKEYYGRARDTFASMVEKAQQDAGFAPSANSVLAARMQLGQSQRRTGEFEAALETFSSILLEREVMLDVQKAAAYTYQEWGEASDPSHFDDAIRGARLIEGTNKNLIWGWNKLQKVAASVARKQPKYKDLFFESWLNIATCRYASALKSAEADKKKKLASAERTIRSMARQYPDLGGEGREEDFDRLLKKIQNERGEQPIGLASE